MTLISGQWIGENIGAGTKSNPSIDTYYDIMYRVNNFYYSSIYYHWDTQTSFHEPYTENWIQGVWAKTRYVGCGYAVCDTGSPYNNVNGEWYYTVCKYFPGAGGNYSGDYPYTEGTKCSDCDADRSRCEGSNGGLCGGDICLDCATDFFQDDCNYTDITCPTDFVTVPEYIYNGPNSTTTTSAGPIYIGSTDTDGARTTDLEDGEDGAEPLVSYFWLIRLIVPAFLLWR